MPQAQPAQHRIVAQATMNIKWVPPKLLTTSTMQANNMLIALMEEYRKAALEYQEILKELSPVLFKKITDEHTQDEDCKSIQSITFHIIQSGYTYSNYINTLEKKRAWKEYNEKVNSPKKGIEEMNKMLDFTEQSINDIIYKSNEEIEKWSFDTRWGVTYDFEQLMEHAIVHILRHRRQVQNVIREH